MGGHAVDPQRHKRTMDERANNEQQTCGESIASIQPTTAGNILVFKYAKARPMIGYSELSRSVWATSTISNN